MKKILLGLSILFFSISFAISETKIKTIYEGNIDAKISLIVYESLTCSHCASFHEDIYLILFHSIVL